MKTPSDKTLEKAVEDAASAFEAYYLDYVNDFLTIAGYSEYYGISEQAARTRIEIGRKMHAQRNP